MTRSPLISFEHRYDALARAYLFIQFKYQAQIVCKLLNLRRTSYVIGEKTVWVNKSPDKVHNALGLSTAPLVHHSLYNSCLQPWDCRCTLAKNLLTSNLSVIVCRALPPCVRKQHNICQIWLEKWCAPKLLRSTQRTSAKCNLGGNVMRSQSQVL